MTEETGLVSEFQQLEEVTKRLGKHTDEPFKLPAASEQVSLLYLPFLLIKSTITNNDIFSRKFRLPFLSNFRS